jgi:AcrR family transcriptional regulator
MSQPSPADGIEPTRLASADRRDSLLDATAELIALGDAEAVSMEAVAERAGVSRPLVYKHFANRHELVAAVYRRESTALHVELSKAVQAAEGLEEMFRALIQGLLRAHATRGATFAALRAAGGRDRAVRDEQHRRDAITIGYFARQATEELSLDEGEARRAVAILLGAIESVLARWRVRPTREHATALEESYVALAMGGLRSLTGRRSQDGRLRADRGRARRAGRSGVAQPSRTSERVDRTRR